MSQESKAESVWETSKENILPLSGGRKMSFLTTSLVQGHDDSMVDEARAHIAAIEKEIMDYRGEDALEPWVKLIEYLQQQRLTEVPEFSTKFKEVLIRCMKRFMNQPLYNNDKRLINVYLKSITNQLVERRISLLSAVLARGFGKKVAKVYISLAEWSEASHNQNMALKYIRDGIEQDAEPREALIEYEKNLEFRIAAELARVMHGGTDSGPLRNFGSGVTLGPGNEAASIRINLPPAEPSKTQFQAPQKVDKIVVYSGDENEYGSNSLAGPTSASLESVREMERIEQESENVINPTRWNHAGTEMNAPVLPDIEKVEVYVSDDEDKYVIPESRRKSSKSVLAERKLEELAEFVEVKINMNPPGIPNAPNKTYTVNHPEPLRTQPRPVQEPKIQNVPSSTSSEPSAFSSGSSVKPSTGKSNEVGLSFSFPAPVKHEKTSTVNGNVKPVSKDVSKDRSETSVDAGAAQLKQRLMYRKQQIFRRGREVSFEQLRAEEYMKNLPKLEPIAAQDTGRNYEQEIAALKDELEQFKESSNKEKAALVEQLKTLSTAFETFCSSSMTQMQTMALDIEALKLKGGSGNFRNVAGSFENTSFATAHLMATPTVGAGTRCQNVDAENLTVDVICKRQLLKHSELSNSESRRLPYTTVETFQDMDGSVSNISIDVIPQTEATEAVFRQHPGEIASFNVSNLTTALKFNPKPIYSSSPGVSGQKRGEVDEEDEFGELQSLPTAFTTPYVKRNNFNQTLQEVAQNLSTIQETSKESRSSTTTSSSNSSHMNNFSSTRNFSTTFFQRSASKSGNPIRFHNSQSSSNSNC